MDKSEIKRYPKWLGWPLLITAFVGFMWTVWPYRQQSLIDIIAGEEEVVTVPCGGGYRQIPQKDVYRVSVSAGDCWTPIFLSPGGWVLRQLAPRAEITEELFFGDGASQVLNNFKPTDVVNIDDSHGVVTGVRFKNKSNQAVMVDFKIERR